MFIIINRTRNLVALGAVPATVRSAATASAATVGYKPVTIAPIVVNHPMISHVSPVKGAGSAGIAASSRVATGE